MKCVCCGNSHTTHKLSRFPRLEARCRSWARACGLPFEEIKDSTRLCHDHFTPDQFEQHRADKLKKLKLNANPNKFNLVNSRVSIIDKENICFISHHVMRKKNLRVPFQDITDTPENELFVSRSPRNKTIYQGDSSHLDEENVENVSNTIASFNEGQSSHLYEENAENVSNTIASFNKQGQSSHLHEGNAENVSNTIASLNEG